MFFFHSASLSYFVPFLLVIAGVVYFVFPKLFNVTLSKDLFLFIGTFVFTSHMIYIAAETKGDNFAAFISYLLNLDIFYICNLILLGIYFKIIYRFEVLKVVINGLRDGLFILRSTFVQIF
ncbi:MAG: hypothetical protein GY858_00400 [Candidatus Omnitrophica bacterium]|nr:hypothetical protein [Candidatus Omnitrophota bacterium]